MMKRLLKQVVRKASAVPGIGRLVRILAALYRLPEIREEVLALTWGHHPRGPAVPPPALWRALAELRENAAGDANLTRSVPVALRRLTRQVQALRQQSQAASALPEPAAAIPALPAGTQPLRLFWGNGAAAPAGYVDLGSDARLALLAPSSVDEVRVAYAFETVAQEALRSEVLPRLQAALKAGACLHVLAADAGAALVAYANAACDYDALRQALYGAPEREGLPRLNMLTADSLAALLREAGFDVAPAASAGMRDGRPYTFETRAAKPAAAVHAS